MNEQKARNIMNQIELDMLNHRRKMSLKSKADSLGVCVYDHGNELNYVRNCDGCGVELCEFCGFNRGVSTYCNSCYEAKS